MNRRKSWPWNATSLVYLKKILAYALLAKLGFGESICANCKLPFYFYYLYELELYDTLIVVVVHGL